MVIIIAEVDLEVDDLVLVDMVEVDRDLGTLDLEKVEMAQLVEQGVDMALVTMRIEGIATKRTMEVHTGAILAVVETIIITTVIIGTMNLNQTNLLHLELATMTSTDSRQQ